MAARITHHPPGKNPVTFVPGDFFIVCDWKEDLLGKLIQAGSRVRYGNTDLARWDHSGMIVGPTGAIVEAMAAGIQLNNIIEYQDADLFVVHTDASNEQRNLAVGQAVRSVGAKYDVLDFVALAIQCIFGGKMSLHSDGRFICSGLVARCTEKYIISYSRAPEQMMPSDLAAHWGVKTGQPLPKQGLFDKFLNGVAAVGKFFRNLF